MACNCGMCSRAISRFAKVPTVSAKKVLAILAQAISLNSKLFTLVVERIWSGFGLSSGLCV